MDNAGTPNNAPKAPSPPDDIPIAARESPTIVSKPRRNYALVWVGGAVLGAIALIAGIFFALRVESARTASDALTSTPAKASPGSAPTPAEMLLGHYAYREAPVSELESITSDGSIRMRKVAAQAYRRMVAAAQQDGVSLVPISGFRSLEDQKYLYFSVKAERGQDAAERAKVSAPPGYSEHHTGYAVDVGDGNVPAVNLSQNFEQTTAFRWLQANAAFHSFEISFPKNNRQGVSYEPWHWRYVGDIDSLKTFYKARSAR